jgi:hypothetical protein
VDFWIRVGAPATCFALDETTCRSRLGVVHAVAGSWPHPNSVLPRANRTGDTALALRAAAELPRVDIEDAFAICLLLRADRARYEGRASDGLSGTPPRRTAPLSGTSCGSRPASSSSSRSTTLGIFARWNSYSAAGNSTEPQTGSPRCSRTLRIATRTPRVASVVRPRGKGRPEGGPRSDLGGNHSTRAMIAARSVAARSSRGHPDLADIRSVLLGTEPVTASWPTEPAASKTYHRQSCHLPRPVTAFQRVARPQHPAGFCGEDLHRRACSPRRRVGVVIGSVALSPLRPSIEASLLRADLLLDASTVAIVRAGEACERSHALVERSAELRELSAPAINESAAARDRNTQLRDSSAGVRSPSDARRMGVR